MFSPILTTALLLAGRVVAQSCSSEPKPWGYFTNNTIYQTSGPESITYPRYVELTDGSIIATAWLNQGYFPIFESLDGGATWEYISDLRDQVNGWGMSAQPALTQITEPMAGYPAGTIFGTGNSWRFGDNGGTKIDLYASLDRARTWEFVSHVAAAGNPNTTNGAKNIFEPYLLQYEGEMIVFYSDERDPLHSQKLAHQTSTDLKTWGPVVNDVAYDEYLARPGMTVVAFIPPLKKWILVHENPIGNSSSYGVFYPVYYVMADSPLEFGKNVGRPIVVGNTTAANASPYVVWSPLGGPNGTIVVSDASRSQVFTNRYGGDLDKWEEHYTPARPVYSRAIQIFKSRPNKLMIYGGETYGDFGKDAGEWDNGDDAQKDD